MFHVSLSEDADATFCAEQQKQKQSRRLFDSLFVLLTFDWLLAAGCTEAQEGQKGRSHPGREAKAWMNCQELVA